MPEIEKPGSASWETCIESRVQALCWAERKRQTAERITACLRREKLVWDRLSTSAFRKLRDGLDESQRAKLIDMQRSWIRNARQTCASLRLFQGTMANPMIANCDNRETRGAPFSMGFADDMANWVDKKTH